MARLVWALDGRRRPYALAAAPRAALCSRAHGSTWLSAPFVLFTIPVLGQAMHHAKPTAYDRSGMLVPPISNEALKKRIAVQAARRSAGAAADKGYVTLEERDVGEVELRYINMSMYMDMYMRMYM